MNQFLYTPLLAFAVSLFLGPVVIPYLRRLKFGQRVRAVGPRRHLAKTGTPTMGGVMFILAFTVATLLYAKKTPILWLALGLTWGYGLLGLVDDYLKVALNRPLGLKARVKLFGQLLLAVLLGLAALELGLGSWVVVPFSSVVIDLGWWYLPFVVLVVLGTANAVNLTDGLDGLAGGASMVAFAVYFLLSLAAGRPELALFCLAVVGGTAGFLRFNLHPAQVFMGDTGSMALGGALAAVAVLTKTELLLVLVGGLFVIEALSVILQVLYFRLTGRRLWRMSPIHHHFELVGWTERQVVYRFWTAALVFGLLGLLGATWPVVESLH